MILLSPLEIVFPLEDYTLLSFYRRELTLSSIALKSGLP
jgi:hypothetical protein